MTTFTQLFPDNPVATKLEMMFSSPLISNDPSVAETVAKIHAVLAGNYAARTPRLVVIKAINDLMLETNGIFTTKPVERDVFGMLMSLWMADITAINHLRGIKFILPEADEPSYDYDFKSRMLFMDIGNRALDITKVCEARNKLLDLIRKNQPNPDLNQYEDAIGMDPSHPVEFYQWQEVKTEEAPVPEPEAIEDELWPLIRNYASTETARKLFNEKNREFHPEGEHEVVESLLSDIDDKLTQFDKPDYNNAVVAIQMLVENGWAKPFVCFLNPLSTERGDYRVFSLANDETTLGVFLNSEHGHTTINLSAIDLSKIKIKSTRTTKHRQGVDRQVVSDAIMNMVVLAQTPALMEETNENDVDIDVFFEDVLSAIKKVAMTGNRFNYVLGYLKDDILELPCDIGGVVFNIEIDLSK